MTRQERGLQYLANLLVGGTGLLYAAMRYFMEPVDEWAVVNHPWQPAVQHLHLLTAPLLVFACGLIWRRHVVDHWRRAARLRRSGPGMALLFLPMIASGYLLQVTVAPGWRQAWVVLHVATSAVWVLAFLVHLRRPLARLVQRVARPRLPEPSAGR